MPTVALACETISDEIKLSAEKVGSRIPIRWIESGLHNSPEKLRRYLQEEINAAESLAPAHILLLFGYCGNALLGLSSRCPLVIPRVDDCISLLLGGNRRRHELDQQAMPYYLTRGWLHHDNNLWHEYHFCLKKYGRERTREIYRLMLKGYKNLYVIRTDAYDPAEILPQTRDLAAALYLQHRVIDGSLTMIRKALLKEWDDDFTIIEAGTTVDLKALRLLPEPLPRADLGG